MSKDFNKLKPFRFWCQKVLPLVYDNSLSYYELLCKVVDYLNKTMEDVNSVINLTESFTTEQTEAYEAFTAGINATVASLTASFNTLQSFVNSYFDNLDVQEEIDNKLDEMAVDGTLTNMVRSVAASMIPGLVSQWLEDNITPTTPAIDRTLSITGAAGDAREVGYRLAWIGDSFNWIDNSKYNISSGETSANNDYARTPKVKGTLNDIIGIRAFTAIPDENAVVLYKNSEYVGCFTYATVNDTTAYYYLLPDGTPTTTIDHDEYAISWLKNETYPLYDWTLRRVKLAENVVNLENNAEETNRSLAVLGDGQTEIENIHFTPSTFINASTGEVTVTSTDTWGSTDFIRIPEGCYKIVSNATAPTATYGLAFYDENKQFINGSGVANYGMIDVPVSIGYKYIRFSNYNANEDHSGIYMYFIGNKYGLYNEVSTPIELIIENATLLKGNYTLNTTVTLEENQKIIGSDCVITVGENGKIVMNNGSAISGIHFVGSWNPTRVHGNGTTYTSYGYVPLITYSDLENGDTDALFGENKTTDNAVIYIPNTTAFNAEVEGCTFEGFDRITIYAGGQRHTEENNPVISNNYFVDCRMGVYIGGEFTRLTNNVYLRCIVGCYLVGGNENNVGEIYKCCDCGFYFATPGTAHNEITSCEFAHCGLAGAYIQEIIARAGAQITGCQFADAPITGLSVNNLDIVGCRLDTWFDYTSGKGNTIICSNIGNAYLYDRTEVFDVPDDTLIAFNRGLGTVDDADVNWKLNVEEDVEDLQEEVSGLKEDYDELMSQLGTPPNILNSDADGVDLDITDPDGNVILRLEDGHIKTKKFDSENIKNGLLKESSDDNSDLLITDTAGNVLAKFTGGNITTKCFDSADVGSADALETTTKTNIVSAINEINGEMVEIESKISRVRTRMKFGAHNGAEYYAPECTVPAYRIAGQQGWEWAWIAGINFSTDGTMYVIHDDTVDRTTDGTGYLNQMSDAEINALNIDQTGAGYSLSDFSPSELKIPTFEQVLQQCVRYGMKMVIRVSLFPNNYTETAAVATWDNFASLLNGYGVQQEDLSFYLDSGTKANICRNLFGNDVEISTHISASASAQSYIDFFDDRSITGKRAAIIHYSQLDSTAVKLLHTNGIRVYAYGSSNVNIISNCATMGVDIFQNDKTYKLTE